MKRMKYCGLIAGILLMIYGINIGIVGIAGYDVIGNIFSSVPIVIKIVQILVGVSAIVMIPHLAKIHK